MQSRKELARGAVPAVPQIARELRQPSKLNGQARIDFERISGAGSHGIATEPAARTKVRILANVYSANGCTAGRRDKHAAPGKFFCAECNSYAKMPAAYLGALNLHAFALAC
jgi:hypothetical protein